MPYEFDPEECLVTVTTNNNAYHNSELVFMLTGRIPDSGNSETQVFTVTFEDRCSNIQLSPPIFAKTEADQRMFEEEEYFFTLARIVDPDLLLEDCGEITYSL